MTMRFFWRHRYLFVEAHSIGQAVDPSSIYPGFQLLDRPQALLALDHVATSDQRFFLQLRQHFLRHAYYTETVPGTWEHDAQNKRHLNELRHMLGNVFSLAGERPHFAQVLVLRRQVDSGISVPLQTPREDYDQALRAADRAPKSFVVVNTTGEDGAPVSRVRIELVLANGDLRTLYTDARGQARADDIPQGNCTIRVAELDKDDWRPAAGGAASVVDRGRRVRCTVQPSQTLASIARDYGAPGWKHLWQSTENQTLRKTRTLPTLAQPGDEVVIPGARIAEIARNTGTTHTLVIKPREIKKRVHWST
jgi:hypothetical protein